MVTIEKYREYSPNTESIIKVYSDTVLVIDRYGVNDYGVWWTDEEHLYDNTYGSSCRGTLEDILSEIKNDLGNL